MRGADSIKPYSLMIEHLGGSNDGVQLLDSLEERHRVFVKGTGLHDRPPGMPFETYRRRRVLGVDVFVHEDIRTPGPVMAAIQRRETRAAAQTPLDQFRRAYDERIYLERMAPLNEVAAWYLVAVIEGQVRSNEWAKISREDFHALMSWKEEIGLKGLFGSITLGDGRMLAWWYPPWLKADTNPDKSELDHALVVQYWKDGQVTYLAKISAFAEWPPPAR